MTRGLLLLLLILYIASPVSAQKFQWANRAGGTGFDEGSGLTVDASGNSYVIGIYSDMANFGPFTLTPTPLVITFSTDAVFLAKYNPLGQVIWVKKVSDANIDFGKDIAVDKAGNIYITGGFSGTVSFGAITLVSNGFGDMYVAKYSSNGEIIWARKGGSSIFTIGHSIALDENSNCYVTGYFRANSVFGSFPLASSGRDDFFIVKYNSGGEVIWAKKAGGNGIMGSAAGTDVAVVPTGECFVTGFFYGPTTFGAFTLPGNSSQGINKDIFLAKYDTNGNVVWANQITNPLEDLPGGLAVDQAGNCYVTGSFLGNATFNTLSLTSKGAEDAFIAKYNPAGTAIWAKNLGGPDSDLGKDLAIGADGSIYITGTFASKAAFLDTTFTSQGESDVFITKCNAAGQEIFTVRAGSATQDEVSKIALDTIGNAYITGKFEQISYFDAISLSSKGDYDMFVAKFGQPFSGSVATSISNNFRDNFDYCAGPDLSVPFRTGGIFAPENSFAVQLSDASGSFGAPVIIGTGTSSPIRATIPPGTPPGQGYQIRVVSTAPVVISNLSIKTLNISKVGLGLSIPNIITPNGDGYNETFTVDISCQEVSLTIYNRWGKKVYEQANYKNTWSGSGLTEGTYYYHLVSEKGLSWKGWLEISR